jgi:hypothetical protein
MKLMKTLLLPVICLAALFAAHPVMARQGALPASRRVQTRPIQAVPQLVITPTDVQAELAKDAGASKSAPLRFAAATEVTVTPATHGSWEAVPGGRIWRLRILSAGATDLNFGFSTYWLPEGATLHVYAEGEDYVQGPYAAPDNKAHGELWTPVLPGNSAVIELFVPAGAPEQPQILLSRIGRGYRDMFQRQKGASDAKAAGLCNIDIVCPVAAPWSNEIRSVARYSYIKDGNGYLCTGSLINDAVRDNRPFFLTATHCEVTPVNAASVIVYWNYKSPTCGQHSGGSLAQNQNGTLFRAARVDTDMKLLELEDMPDPSFNTYYAGWDNSGVVPSGAVGIHHPGGFEKSISFSTNPIVTTDNCIGTGGINTHWDVTWSSGVTEQGSSGSGIWDPVSHRIVGTLSGGGSSCDFPFAADCYGKFSVAWTNGSSSAERLQYWLDPLNTGISGVSGGNFKSVPLIRESPALLTAESCTTTNGRIDPGETVTIAVPLRNVGLLNTTNLIATLLPMNGVTAPSAPQNYGALIVNGATVTRSFTFTASGACGGSVGPRIQLQDGTNVWGVVSYTFNMGVPVLASTQYFDNVSSPVLPAGWTTTVTGPLTPWSTTTTEAHTAPNSAYASNSGTTEGESILISPVFVVLTTNSQIIFAHHYNVEADWDGGVLEMSVNNGAFADILASGASFVSRPYDGVLAASSPGGYISRNPLVGRNAWTGDSGGFVTTTINLPASLANQSIRLRWRLSNDQDFNVDGWYVDTFILSSGYSCCQPLATPQILESRRTNNNFIFSFNTVTGRTYIAEYKNTLNTNLAWTPLQTNAGDGTKKSVTNSTTAATNRFFRVKAQ